MNGRSVIAPLLQLEAHPCTGSVWVLRTDGRGAAHSAFCGHRALHGGVPVRSWSDRRHVVQLDEELRRSRRRVPAGVLVGTDADPFVPRADDLRGPVLEMMAMLLRRGIPVALRTRGGLADSAALVTLARRFPQLLTVDVGFFSPDRELHRIWEHGVRSVESRLDLIQALRAAGVRVTARLGPIVPMVNDAERPIRHWIAALHRAGGQRVAPYWIQDAPGLVEQVEREVARSAGRALEGWFRMPGASQGGGHRKIAESIRRRGLDMIARAAEPHGIEVVRCACVITGGRDHCIGPFRGAPQREQLDLFADLAS